VPTPATFSKSPG